jgi:A/G-specific adenine glycosylase
MSYQESGILREWYRKHERDLPWRHTKDPYRIWISEIILQQTRVAQGLDYYERFVARFPDVKSLAEAEQQDVLKCWQGLGYYSRARNLHEAAKDILLRHNGIFPERYNDILALKGIGEYTAAAIASFVWNRPYPVIDGNVYRVLGRLYALTAPVDTGEGKKTYRELATLLMPPDHAGMHNQAMMEFGALQCVSQHPDCEQCPLSDHCLGFASGNPQQYPVKRNKTKTRNRYLNYFFILHDSYTYLHRRTGKDIWEGLYEFPMIETSASVGFTELKNETTFDSLFHGTGEPSVSLVRDHVKHVLSHQILHVTFYRVKIQKENVALKKYVKIPLSALDEYPYPRLIDSFLTETPE